MQRSAGKSSRFGGQKQNSRPGGAARLGNRHWGGSVHCFVQADHRVSQLISFVTARSEGRVRFIATRRCCLGLLSRRTCSCVGAPASVPSWQLRAAGFGLQVMDEVMGAAFATACAPPPPLPQRSDLLHWMSKQSLKRRQAVNGQWMHRTAGSGSLLKGRSMACRWVP